MNAYDKLYKEALAESGAPDDNGPIVKAILALALQIQGLREDLADRAGA